MSRIHVIGGGLAGLSAAIAATGAGRPVTLYESTAAGGGRCRSYFDPELGIRLDNGNHLLLSGNKSAFAYINQIGAKDRITGPRNPVFPFVDLKSGREWTLRPSRGRIPWWLLFADRRVPKTTAGEHLAIRHLGREWDDTVMTETMRHSSLYWLLLEPLAVATLNTRPHEALACLFGAVLRETLLKGGKAILPRLPKEGLSEALVDPAIDTLRKRGADVRFNQRITGLTIEKRRVTAFETTSGPVAMEPDDAVVLAVPPWVAGELMPDLTVPDAFESILNVHFKIELDPEEVVAEAGFVGLINGTADDLAATVWRNVAKALDLDGPQRTEVPPYRVIKERRATIVANVTQEERRPGAETDIENLTLAGDWTDTRLPGTIEGAIRSGVTATKLILNPPKTKGRRRKKRLSPNDD
jgi:hydroxysqualene dehydroxylase